MSFAQGMHRLVSLKITDQSLTGSVSLQNLTQLRSITAERNRLSGDLAPLPGALTSARLRGNRISGLGQDAIPPSLRLLDLGDNELHYDLSELNEKLPRPSRLVFLNVSGNRLSGNLGSFIDGVCEKTEILGLYASKNEGVSGLLPLEKFSGRFREMDLQTDMSGRWQHSNFNYSMGLSIKTTELNLTGLRFLAVDALPEFWMERKAAEIVARRDYLFGRDFFSYSSLFARDRRWPGKRGQVKIRGNRVSFNGLSSSDKYILFLPAAVRDLAS